MIKDYLFSYTAATMMTNEVHNVALVYSSYIDWDKTRDVVVEENSMQKNAISSRKRVFAELKRRLETMTKEQFEYFLDSSASDMRNLVFLTILKSYHFIYEFMVEVVLRKILIFDYKILNSDYESFFESKKHGVKQLENITDSTASKIKQVLFKILEEASIIDSTKNKNIQKPHLSTNIIELIIKDNPNYLKAFLYTDYEIEKFKERYL